MQYIILGIIQGLTEFLPVSSSGHLVLFSKLFSIDKSQVLPIIIVCHLGTLFALLVFFIRDILKAFRDLVTVGQIMVVTLATGIIALIGRRFFEQLFQSPDFVCLALLVTAIFLISTPKFKRGTRTIEALNIKDAFWLGISQGFAIIPGISRSGITIFTLLARGVKPEAAFKFSFIAGIPVFVGSFLLEAGKIQVLFEAGRLNFWLALISSFVFGLLGLFILRRAVKKLRLHYFAYYLILASIIGFVIIK